MSQNSEIFLSTFNRIENYIKEQLHAPDNLGFTQGVRRLSKRNSRVRDVAEDLIQMAQLRNAIIHEKIAENFVIAEPNEWVITRIQEIENLLLHPELVIPRFGKNVVGFEDDLSLKEMLKGIAHNRYSQFPIYQKGKFQGLITIQGIAIYIAIESQKNDLDFEKIKAKDIVKDAYKEPNYCFCTPDTPVEEVRQWFYQTPTLEAVLITKKGVADGHLLGIIRPRDITLEESITL